nr:HAD-IIA family hydrolase [Corynebacterium aquatimens]
MLLDLDGTVWAGHNPIPYAVEAINAAALPAMYVTNNASKGPEEVAGALRGIGLDVAAENVMTSAQAAVKLAEQYLQPGDPVYVVGAPSFKELVAGAGFRVVESADDKPIVVLHGHHPDNGWRTLAEAVLAINAGARYLASNLDSTLPTARGMALGNGSMVAAVTNATGVVPQAAGKPGPAMFEIAQQTLGSQRPLVVGDRLDTDIAGGVAAGMDTLHVLTGVSGPWALLNAPVSQRPTFIAENMTALSESAADLAPQPQGGFTASVNPASSGTTQRTVVLAGGDGDSTPIQALRTVLAAAWAEDTADGSGDPTPEFTVEAQSPSARKAVESWW